MHTKKSNLIINKDLFRKIKNSLRLSFIWNRYTINTYIFS